MATNISLSRRRRNDYYHLLEQVDTYEWQHRKSVRITPSRSGNGSGRGNGNGSGSYKPSFKTRGGSYSYKQEQAKKRQIFLRSYNLSFEHQRPGVVGKLKQSIGKVKKTVLSVVAFARFNFFTSCRLVCGQPHAICSSSVRPAVETGRVAHVF